jgi:hypothetical protein
VPRAYLEFNLPEDNEDHWLAIKAGSLHSVLYEFDNYLRNKLKHGDLSEPVDEALSITREYLNDLMHDYDVQGLFS